MLIAAALIAASLAAKGSEALRASEVLDEEAAVTRPPARVAVDD
jgi:hypothetical protein